MFSFFSKLLRKRRYKKEKKRTIRLFQTYKSEIERLPAPISTKAKILLIRLDDIGDYILFRNTMASWKKYAVEQNSELYLLGNEAWKSLFDTYDSGNFIHTIWLNKKRYFADNEYRCMLWGDLRKEGFETVICPARSRPLLLDDICMLATGAKITIAGRNLLSDVKLNFISDKQYTHLQSIGCTDAHEFVYNVAFLNTVANLTTNITLDISSNKPDSSNYILLFVGASAASKQWPVASWRALILKLQQCFTGTIFVAGGPAEIQMANEASRGTDAQNIAGKKSLPEMVTLIGNATLVISNDTMAAHIAAAAATNTVIIANGTNAYRFTDYSKLSLQSVTAVYSKRYTKLRFKKSAEALRQFSGIKADIQSISVEDVFDKAKGYLSGTQSM